MSVTKSCTVGADAPVVQLDADVGCQLDAELNHLEDELHLMCKF